VTTLRGGERERQPGHIPGVSPGGLTRTRPVTRWAIPVGPTPGHRDTGTPGHRDTGTPGHRDTGTPGHRDTGTPGHRDQHLPPGSLMTSFGGVLGCSAQTGNTYALSSDDRHRATARSLILRRPHRAQSWTEVRVAIHCAGCSERFRGRLEAQARSSGPPRCKSARQPEATHGSQRAPESARRRHHPKPHCSLVTEPRRYRRTPEQRATEAAHARDASSADGEGRVPSTGLGLRCSRSTSASHEGARTPRRQEWTGSNRW
jgi:hypothetical protein